ncbi:hypothetical protein [Kordia jejudonensis]|uniref:hypothetical protein n=1 Tax=Kordia jejudonensis TaxID=1348245 RepID=UPI0012E06CC6|nr:hypothetical protein [Kordia jejudonensis]
MKKRVISKLGLNKKQISKLTFHDLRGGRAGGGETDCEGTCTCNCTEVHTCDCDTEETDCKPCYSEIVPGIL